MNTAQEIPQTTLSPPQLTVGLAITQFCEEWLRISNRSLKTIAAYRVDLDQFSEIAGKASELESVSRRTVERWILDLQQRGYRPASLRRKMASLRGFFRHFVERGTLRESPVAGIRVSFSAPTKLPRIVDQDDLASLLRSLERGVESAMFGSMARTCALRDLAVFRILAVTGIRVAELCHLTVQDVLESGSTLRIHGKGSRERLAFLALPLDRSCLEEYMLVRHQLRPQNQSLFLNARGLSLTTEGVRGILHGACRTVGVNKRITPHMLRHTAATSLLENGADLRIVQTYLGHSSIRSTERYTHLSMAHLRAVVERCHPLRSVA